MTFCVSVLTAATSLECPGTFRQTVLVHRALSIRCAASEVFRRGGPKKRLSPERMFGSDPPASDTTRRVCAVGGERTLLQTQPCQLRPASTLVSNQHSAISHLPRVITTRRSLTMVKPSLSGVGEIRGLFWRARRAQPPLPREQDEITIAID